MARTRGGGGSSRRLRVDDHGTVGGDRIEVRGCDLWTIGDDGLVLKKDSFWKLREP
ncbi:MAG TPA: hypothetical protein VIB62_01865 [Actinomycetota bacterium]